MGKRIRVGDKDNSPTPSFSCHLILLPSHSPAISFSCQLILLPSHSLAISFSCQLIPLPTHSSPNSFRSPFIPLPHLFFGPFRQLNKAARESDLGRAAVMELVRSAAFCEHPNEGGRIGRLCQPTDCFRRRPVGRRFPGLACTARRVSVRRCVWTGPATGFRSVAVCGRRKWARRRNSIGGE